MEDKEMITSLKDTLREARRLLRSDRAMRLASYQEAIMAFFSGDMELGKLNLRDVVKYGIGYDALVLETQISMQSINRMLSRRGNPTTKHLFAILRAIRKYEGIEMHLQVSLKNAGLQNVGNATQQNTL
jgi:DNA-binding phage protein